ncbi:MAG TPA: FkbM family methyltransferase [Flavisolibacter sp.]|nr:FkbM family methyltransferase [Flavisolibacter sp.]
MLQKQRFLQNKKLKAFLLYSEKLGFGGTLLFALRKMLTPKGKLIPVRVKNGGKLFLRNKFYDTAIFSQIFIYEELNFTLPSAPKIIIDCGANIGLATLYFKFKYPQAQIISIEPETSNFAMLQKNTSVYSNINLIKKGIWNKACDLYLIDSGEGHASFQVSESNPGKNVIGHIEAIGINEILEKFKLSKVDLLKMDIEGSEYTCFNSDNLTWVDKAGCIAIEIHEHMIPGCKALIDRSLRNRKYELNGEYHIYCKTLAT